MSASGYQPDVNQTIMITASSPVVVKKDANTVVAAGELWRTTCSQLRSFMASYSLDKVLGKNRQPLFFMRCRNTFVYFNLQTNLS